MSQTAAYAFAGGMIGAMVLGVVVFYVLVVIACWKLFNKMGEPGWKSIIPFYNEYILFKKCWKTNLFWAIIVLAVVGDILMAVDPGAATGNYGIIGMLGVIVLFVAVVINLLLIYHVGVSFGHGIPLFILSIFVPNIVLLYLGFNKEEYQGNLSEK